MPRGKYKRHKRGHYKNMTVPVNVVVMRHKLTEVRIKLTMASGLLDDVSYVLASLEPRDES